MLLLVFSLCCPCSLTRLTTITCSFMIWYELFCSFFFILLVFKSPIVNILYKFANAWPWLLRGTLDVMGIPIWYLILLLSISCSREQPHSCLQSIDILVLLFFLFLCSVKGFSTKSEPCTYNTGNICKPTLANAFFSTICTLSWCSHISIFLCYQSWLLRQAQWGLWFA